MPKPLSVDLGVMTRVEGVLAAVGPVAGLRIIDIGCGEGEVARALAERGAIVAGYDPFISGVDSEWTSLGAGRFRLAQASANRIPEPEASADIVLFVFSLHHVPQAQLGSALKVAARLLKPSGRLCVAEPLAEGPNQHVMELYHDETAVRRLAASALVKHVAPVFGSERVLYFDERREVLDFESFASQAIAGVRYNDYSEQDVLSSQVRQRFGEMVAAYGGRFDQPVRINLFAEPAGA